MRVVDPLVVDGHSEVPGRAERFQVRVYLFKGAPHGFFTLVDAEENLGRGPGFQLTEAAVMPMTREAAQDFPLMPPLVGQVQNASPLQSVAGSHFNRKRS